LHVGHRAGSAKNRASSELRPEANRIEPFVSGADDMIDHLVAGILNSDS
jgi:hypothetical protein